jgi:uncharacterized protein
MLELRPSCEHCNKPLPPHSTEAMICSFECTFCAHCVSSVLENVCPNCGGGFTQRPVRPHNNLRNGNHLAKYPAGVRVVHKPVDPETHARFAADIRAIPPEQR